MVRRITRDLHTRRLIESLACESSLQVPLRRKCPPDCSYVETTFVYRLLPRLSGSSPSLVDSPPSLLPSKAGGSTSFSKIDTSVRSMLGTQTLLSMQFIEDAEKENEKETGAHDTELEAMDSIPLTHKESGAMETGAYDAELEAVDAISSAQKVKAQKEAIKALRMLFEDFEDRVQCQNEVNEGSSSESEEPYEEKQAADPLAQLQASFHFKKMKLCCFQKRSDSYAMIGFNLWQWCVSLRSFMLRIKQEPMLRRIVSLLPSCHST